MAKRRRIVLRAAEEPQLAPAGFWKYTTRRGWAIKRRSPRPWTLKAATDKRRKAEVLGWFPRGMPLYSAGNPGLLRAFMTGSPPPGVPF